MMSLWGKIPRKRKMARLSLSNKQKEKNIVGSQNSIRSLTDLAVKPRNPFGLFANGKCKSFSQVAPHTGQSGLVSPVVFSDAKMRSEAEIPREARKVSVRTLFALGEHVGDNG